MNPLTKLVVASLPYHPITSHVNISFFDMVHYPDLSYYRTYNLLLNLYIQG